MIRFRLVCTDCRCLTDRSTHLEDGEELVDTSHLSVLVVRIEVEARLVVVDHGQFVSAAHSLDRIGVRIVVYQPCRILTWNDLS